MFEHFSPQTLAYEGFRGLNMPLADAFLNILSSLSVMSWMWLTKRFSKDNVRAKLFCTYCPTIIKPLTFLILWINQHWGDYSHCQITGSWLTRFFRDTGQQLWFPTSTRASQGYRNKPATAEGMDFLTHKLLAGINWSYKYQHKKHQPTNQQNPHT